MSLSNSLFGKSTKPMPLPSSRPKSMMGGNPFNGATKMPSTVGRGSTPRPMGPSSSVISSMGGRPL